MTPARSVEEGSPFAVYAVLVGIAVVAGLAIAVVYEVTAERVAQQQDRQLSEAVQEVLPGTVHWEARFDSGAASPQLFAAYNAEQRLIGFAVPAEGMGYQDHIRLLYGIDTSRGRILGLRVLDSRETPGLGARIAEDAAFLAQFRDRPINFDPTGTPRALSLSGRAESADGIDAITGATVSSQAVVRIINESLARWWPELDRLEVPNG
jgi:Na+-translocating ferredoxin:NAD+ oxidoreductase subunit G